MSTLISNLRRRIDRTADRGASAVEYGLMVAAIAATLVAVVFGLGGFVQKTFDDTCAAIAKSTSPDCTTKAPAEGGTGG